MGGQPVTIVDLCALLLLVLLIVAALLRRIDAFVAAACGVLVVLLWAVLPGGMLA